MSEREDSVLTNLKELMNLEDERISKEEQEARRRAEEQARRKAEEEARIKAEEEARIRAEEQARLDEERRAREEEERKVREKEEAELRVRLEMEQRARAEEQSRILAHETKLKEIEATRRKGVHPAVFVATAILVLGGAAYGYFGIYIPAKEQAERRAAEAMKLAEIQSAEKQRIEEQLRAMENRERELKGMLDAARNTQDKEAADRAEKEIQRLSDERKRIMRRPSTASGKTSDRERKPGKREDFGGDDNDPLKGLEGL